MNLRIMDVKPMRQAFFFFVWQEKDKRRDPDNISSAATKFILDAMVRSKLLDNDGWNQVKGHCHKYITSKGNPGVSISMIDPALHPEKLQEYYELIIKDLLNVR